MNMRHGMTDQFIQDVHFLAVWERPHVVKEEHREDLRC